MKEDIQVKISYPMNMKKDLVQKDLELNKKNNKENNKKKKKNKNY
jgi:hypothetical protein